MDYLFIFGLFVFCMIGSTISDLTTFKIPNLYSFLLIFGFIIFSPFYISFADIFYSHLFIFFVCLFIGFIIFAFGFMGGGDIKLLSATILWFGYPLGLNYLLLAILLGGLFALLLFFIRLYPLPIFMLRVGWIHRLHDSRSGLPYGVCLGSSGLYIFPSSIWF